MPCFYISSPVWENPGLYLPISSWGICKGKQRLFPGLQFFTMIYSSCQGFPIKIPFYSDSDGTLIIAPFFPIQEFMISKENNF